MPVSPVEDDSGNSDQPSDPGNVDCCGRRRLVWWEFRESGNRLGLPISSFSLNDQQKLESPVDPNTNYSFGIAQIGGRSPQLTVDPLATLIATRDTLAQISGVSQFNGVLRSSGAAGNRWGITLPLIQPATAQPGIRGELRKEDITYQATSASQDARRRLDTVFLLISRRRA